MAKLRVQGFDAFKKGLKEGIFNPGFITELEEESIDALTDDKAAPAAEPTADAPAEEAPAEQTTDADVEAETEAPAEEAPVEEAPAEEGDLDFGADETEAQPGSDPEVEKYKSKIEFVSGIWDEYKKYSKSGTALPPAMKKKIDRAFDIINSPDEE